MAAVTRRSLSDVPCSNDVAPDVAREHHAESARAALGLPRAASVAAPRGLVVGTFSRLEGEARRQAALPVLRDALARVRAGWCQGAMTDGTGRVSLYGAIATGTVEAEYAREVLREVSGEWDLIRWNDHPARRKAEVVALLMRAIARAGKHLRRGGWTVVSGGAR